MLRTRVTFFLPLIIFATWWVTAWVIYMIRWPIPYAGTNFGQVNFLIATTLLLSILAFVLSARLTLHPRVANQVAEKPLLISIVGLWTSVILLIPFAELYSGYHVWEILTALSEQGEAFELASDRISEGTASRLVFVVVQSALYPLTMIAIPYFALAWFEYRKFGWYFVVSCIPPVVTSILVGRDFQMIMAAALVATAWLVARVRSGRGIRWREVAFAVLLAVVGLTLFILRKATRGAIGLPSSCLPGAQDGACAEAAPAGPVEGSFAIIASYASQSFEGLGRALDGDWNFGGGFSHSLAVRGLIDSIVQDPLPIVITDQLESVGWSSTAYWSTGLAFIANDVPWPAVPVAVALHVLVLAVLWRSVVDRGDWLSISLFSYTFVSVFFLLQNLQLAISGPLYIGYNLLLALFVVRSVVEFWRERSTGTSSIGRVKFNTSSK